MRSISRAWAFMLAPVLFGVAQPTSCSAPPICQATGTGTCYYADDLPGRGGRGTFADPFRLGDLPSSASDCDDRGGLPRAMRPGDVFYFRAGLYPLDLCANPADGAWYKPAIDAQGDGTATQPIVFRSYPGERATLRRRSGVAPLAGSYTDDHIRFIGLGFQYPRVSPADDNLGSSGRHPIVILGADHVAFAYNAVTLFDHPKASGTTDNHDAFYLDNADFAYIGHNRIRGPGNPANPNPATGCTGFKAYRVRFSVIEDNWFDGAVSPIVDKEEGVDNTYRRNLTTRSSYASFTGSGNDLPRWGRARIHDNVFDRGILVTFLGDGYEVYRNDLQNSSLYNAHGASKTRRVYRSAVYDNIVRWSGDAVIFTGNRSGQSWQERNQVFSYLDHNCYIGSGVRPLYKFAGSSDYDTRDLASMRLAGFEKNSRAVPSQAGCGAARFGGAVGPTHPALVAYVGRYGPGNESAFPCSDGIDQDGDWRVDFPADPDCSSPAGTSEGSGISDVAPRIVSVGGPYVSRNGAPVALNVTVADPDSFERVSWQIQNDALCNRSRQSFAPTQLVEDPVLQGLPVANGRCIARVSVYDHRGRAATRAVPITLQAD